MYKESREAIEACAGEILASIELVDSPNGPFIRLSLAGGSVALDLVDTGQSCCEHRYMTSDDDFAYYEGATLLGVEVKPGPDVEAKYDTHETAFLDIKTSRGVFTVVTHNEHNGYYGGFSLRARKVML